LEAELAVGFEYQLRLHILTSNKVALAGVAVIVICCFILECLTFAIVTRGARSGDNNSKKAD
jgi:hypothetical protein